MINVLQNPFSISIQESDINKTYLFWIIRLRWFFVFGILLAVLPLLMLGVLNKDNLVLYIGFSALLGLFNLLSQLYFGSSLKSIKSGLITFQLLFDLAILLSLSSLLSSHQLVLFPLYFLHLVLGSLVLETRQIIFFLLGMNYFLGLYRWYISNSYFQTEINLTDSEWLLVHVLTLLFGFIFFNFGRFTRQKNDALLKTHQTRHQQDRLKTLGALTAGMVHEFANPLQHIRFAVEGIHQSHPSQESELCLESLEKCESVLRQMNHGQFDFKDAEFSSFNLKLFLQSLASKWSDLNQVVVHVRCSDDLVVVLPKMNFAQVMINLLDNSFEAGETSQIQITIHQDGPWVEISVLDSGKGFLSEVIPKLGQPFVTSKKDGVGLGFYAVHLFCQLVNGKWSIDKNHEPMGAKVTLRLPVIGGQFEKSFDS